jgi:catechol 2,3-dioxygenase-like lactoylglutathione lyase family enzyme
MKMTDIIIEHVNLTVRDPQATAELMKELFGWHIRWEGPSMANGYTIHVGTQSCYLALYAGADRDYPDSMFTKGQPLNHVAVVVDDLGAIESKVKAAGLKPFSHSDYNPGGRSFYFYDRDGIEFEVVSYRQD